MIMIMIMIIIIIIIIIIITIIIPAKIIVFRDQSEIYNYRWSQLSNNKFINVFLGVMLDLV